MNLIEHTEKSIANAVKGISNIDSRILSLSGMSSAKIRHFLNNITSFPGCRYLEVGCWKGSTTISALYQNKPEQYWVIDDFSESFIDCKNAKDDFITNFQTILTEPPNLIDMNFLSINLEEKGINGVNVYLYDGKHTEEAQRQALLYYYNSLADEFIFLVDDWNWDTVKKGTRDGISELKLVTLFEKELPARSEGQDLEHWWNGFYVAVLKKP